MLFFYIFGASFIKQLFHSRLLKYEMIVANSYSTHAYEVGMGVGRISDAAWSHDPFSGLSGAISFIFI